MLCGLPGSGKTTLAKPLTREIPAVRLCPDAWMSDLGIDLLDERTRDRLERRFWGHAQELPLMASGHASRRNWPGR
ncbi:AAA family ATPase [Streptomyces xiangluensis]|uniref:AAA family ATPase n=1 Tax=Streptomyces xiangluensis TaxID=2665720 RepID=A0ABV8YGI7_9ACTN